MKAIKGLSGKAALFYWEVRLISSYWNADELK